MPKTSYKKDECIEIITMCLEETERGEFSLGADEDHVLYNLADFTSFDYFAVAKAVRDMEDRGLVYVFRKCAANRYQGNKISAIRLIQERQSA